MPTRSSTDLFSWLVLGGVIGVGLGIAAGGWLKPGLRGGPWDDEEAGPAEPLLPRAAARAVRRALRADPDLAAGGLEPVAVGPGAVELHGWVASRAQRTRAVRLARQVRGIERLVDCLLVHGDDDRSAPGSP